MNTLSPYLIFFVISRWQGPKGDEVIPRILQGLRVFLQGRNYHLKRPVWKGRNCKTAQIRVVVRRAGKTHKVSSLEDWRPSIFRKKPDLLLNKHTKSRFALTVHAGVLGLVRLAASHTAGVLVFAVPEAVNEPRRGPRILVEEWKNFLSWWGVIGLPSRQINEFFDAATSCKTMICRCCS